MYDVYQSLYPTCYNRWTRNPHYRDEINRKLKNSDRLLWSVNGRHEICWCSYDTKTDKVSEYTNDKIHPSFYDGLLVGRVVE